MDSEILTTATVLVLCASAGVRAYLPLLAMGVAARGGVVPLQPGFEWLSEPWVLGVLGILATVEFLADKVPGIDSVNDAIHTVVRPLAGALIFAVSNNVVSEQSLPAAVVLGLALAGGVHGAKTLARPVATTTTAGMANPVISFVEDVGVIGLLVLAILVPLVALAVAGLMVLLFVLAIAWWRERRRRQRLEQRPVSPYGPWAGQPPG